MTTLTIELPGALVRREGYTYCVRCGRIEASTERSGKLTGPHQKPCPEDDDRRVCEGLDPSRHIVLGTDFITDIALFSMRVMPPLNLKPAYTASKVALRTVSEALARAACELLELEPGELMAEYRPALTPGGKERSRGGDILVRHSAGGRGILAGDRGAWRTGPAGGGEATERLFRKL